MPDLKFTAALSDRYVIQRELGAGGMAVVYLARDKKLDREVALKVLRPELGAVLGADRFLAEIKISARLDHPHILTLIDSGDADGLLYYVLPYVRGETLREKLVREQQLGLEEALAITRQVASALDYAHRQGLVHRDIKPENIMIQEGEAMLTDFGIALAVKEAGGNRLTQTGLSLGTPQYMSPEQATGDRGVDARSDVYSLASVLYEMLAGEPPVTGATAQAMIAKLMTERPTRLKTLRDTVPDGIDAAVTKALAKTPADRFPSAGEFAKALHVGTTEPSLVGVAPSGRRRTLLVGAAALLVVAAGAGYALRGSHAHGDRAALGQKTQLTVSGGVTVPAISPDGKQLAHVARSCAASCTYSVVVQDVGGTTTRTILDGATSAYALEWSPDRRNLILQGTVRSHFGTYLLSALGGEPRFLSPGVATFYAGGDSLLLGPAFHPDSAYWVRVAALDGTVADSIRVKGPGQGLAGISSVPGTQWILTLVLQQPHGLWQVIDRKGNVADHVVNQCTCGGIATVDAVFLDREGDAAGESIVRIGLDRTNGHLASKQDTMITGLFTNVSLTADGSKMVMDVGTLDYSVWALDLADVLKGTLPDERRIAHASNDVIAWASPDGARVLFMRAVPTVGVHTERRYSVASFSGTGETPLATTGRVLDAGWVDSVTVYVATETPTGSHLALTDVRTGAQREATDVPDSSLRAVAGWPGGWAWIPSTRDRVVILEGGKRREIKQPQWYGGVFGLSADPAGRRVAFVGYNAANNDTVGVGVINVADDSVTQWAALHADGGFATVLPDQSVLLDISATEESQVLYRVTAPGRLERIGAPGRPLLGITASADLKRATAVGRDYQADAWMYDVQRREK